MYWLDKVLDFKMLTSFSAETKSNVLLKSKSIVTIEILKRQMFTSWQVLNRIGTWPTWHLLSFKNFFEYGLENRGVPRVRHDDVNNHDDVDDGDDDDDDGDDDQQLQDCNYMFFKHKKTNEQEAEDETILCLPRNVWCLLNYFFSQILALKLLTFCK